VFRKEKVLYEKMPEKCPDFNLETAIKYFVDELEGNSLKEYEKHLAGCNICSSKIKELSKQEEFFYLLDLSKYPSNHVKIAEIIDYIKNPKIDKDNSINSHLNECEHCMKKYDYLKTRLQKSL